MNVQSSRDFFEIVEEAANELKSINERNKFLGLESVDILFDKEDTFDDSSRESFLEDLLKLLDSNYANRIHS